MSAPVSGSMSRCHPDRCRAGRGPVPRAGAAVRARAGALARQPVPGVRGARPDPGAARGRGGRHAAAGARPLRGAAPGPAGGVAGALRADRAPGARRRGPVRATPRPDRRLVHPRVRGRGGRPVQPVGGRAPRPERPAARAVPVRAEPARGRRGAPVVGRVPHRGGGSRPGAAGGRSRPARRVRPRRADPLRPGAVRRAAGRPGRRPGERRVRHRRPAVPVRRRASWRRRWPRWPRSG